MKLEGKVEARKIGQMKHPLKRGHGSGALATEACRQPPEASQLAGT